MATGNGADVCHTTCSKSEKGRSWDFKFGITIIDDSVLSQTSTIVLGAAKAK